jgi:hypothetical protein
MSKVGWGSKLCAHSCADAARSKKILENLKRFYVSNHHRNEWAIEALPVDVHFIAHVRGGNHDHTKEGSQQLSASNDAYDASPG